MNKEFVYHSEVFFFKNMMLYDIFESPMMCIYIWYMYVRISVLTELNG